MAEIAKRILKFDQLGFGMFIHWGLYSQPCLGEWAYDVYKYDMEEYKKLKDTFTAEDFDAEQLVQLAKKAGCKYMILTTRHHDGFSLYDTCGLSDFDSVHSPAKRDLVREFVDACRKYDVVPFLYHTLIDWYQKDYQEDFHKYLDYLIASVEILCKNYGEIGGFWFDGIWAKRDADWREDELYGTIRKYQPEAMIINNSGMSARGRTGHPELDSLTFENGLAEPVQREYNGKYLAAESCQTMNDHWGLGYGDFRYKAPATIIENLCNCRKVGANYVLNLGPEAQGKPHYYQEAAFRLIGEWMDIFGEAIYNGRPYVYKTMTKNFILKSVNEDYLYIFAYDLGNFGNINVTVGGKYSGSFSFNGVTDEIESVQWMDNGEELDFIQGKGMFCVNLTAHPYAASFGVRVAKAKIKK